MGLVKRQPVRLAFTLYVFHHLKLSKTRERSACADSRARA